jgi:uncharacterized repeat protein (TIGR03803 family)
VTRPQAERSKLQIRSRAETNLALPVIEVLCLLFVIASAEAQTFTILHAFSGKGDSKYPYHSLLRDNTGTMYGTTGGGGSFDYGTVFEMKPDGKDTVLHSFWGADGVWPLSRLVRDPAGDFYGTTSNGGTPEGGACFHGCGTVFKLDTAGKLTVLYVFTGGTDGGQPKGGLILDHSGNLYGTTTIGGDLNCRTDNPEPRMAGKQGHAMYYYGSGCGVVFKIDPKGHETVLHAFAGKPDGWYPTGELIRDTKGNFYGATWFGGTEDYGTIYKMDISGKVTVLYSFQGIPGAEYPNGPLVRDAQGNFYGTTTNGGEQNYGTVFKVDTGGKEITLHSFTGGNDGYAPYVGVTQDGAGNLYGVTIWGGGSTGCYGLGCGTLFKVDTRGNETVLHGFTGGADGSEPEGALIMDKSGNLYGTAPGGGDLSCGSGIGCGVVFRLTL